MVSAASRAAKALAGVGRNRPSRSMGGSSKASDVEDGGGPEWMESHNSQYGSLSDKLAKENAAEAAALGENDPSKMSRKVRWNETAKLASTMDAEHTLNNPEDDPDYIPPSPIDTMSDLFTKKYTMPIFLIGATVIFLLVHLAGPSDHSFDRYNPYGRSDNGDGSSKTDDKGSKINIAWSRQFNVDADGDESKLLFVFVYYFVCGESNCCVRSAICILYILFSYFNTNFIQSFIM